MQDLSIVAPGQDSCETFSADVSTGIASILICLLGDFQLLYQGRSVNARVGAKMEQLLSSLALRYQERVPREALQEALWSGVDPPLASQSLNSLVHCVKRFLAPVLGGVMPVAHQDGYYWLNGISGVSVDIVLFDRLVDAGDQQIVGGDQITAALSYERALKLYRGDLRASVSVFDIIERERLRARYLTVLARLADHEYAIREFGACLRYSWRLLACDPCREDAHRLVMRSHAARGERAQAMRQYSLCKQILNAEFQVEPEPATTDLFERIKQTPGNL